MVKHLWIRNETKINECRVPLVPLDTQKLISHGFKVTVERSKNRCFPIEEYRQVGCQIVPENSWIHAPKDSVIIGIKELPSMEFYCHRHIYFAHCFKGQDKSQELLRKFKKGGGKILDLEYLVNDKGERLAAFGKSAGIAGTLIGMNHWISTFMGEKMSNLKPVISAKSEMVYLSYLIEKNTIPLPSVLIIGANGRSGRGVREILESMEIKYDTWDKTNTMRQDNREELLEYDIIINCINLRDKMEPFLTPALLSKPRKLSLCVDISCDYENPMNPIAIYNRGTTYDEPVLRVADDPPMDIIAIDNLPSYISRASSYEFSNQLEVLLEDFDNSPVWDRVNILYDAVINNIE